MTAAYHLPVLADEAIDLLQARAGQTLLDCTLGGGGHARRFAAVLGPAGRIVGIDRDSDALEEARGALEGSGPGVVLLHGDFRECVRLLASVGIHRVDAALMDLGVSSHQLDVAERGFSFRLPAPLDMRMDRSGGTTAADIVNGAPEAEIRRILTEYGEERWAARIAKVIVARRAARPFETTTDLADVVTGAIPAGARPRDIHAATRSFQGLRIAVNDELGALRDAVDACVDLLSPGGRLGVMSYHSLEDRIVKQAFVRLSGRCQCPPGLPVCRCGAVQRIEIVTRKPVMASASEVAANPRARSARLRVAAKTM